MTLKKTIYCLLFAFLFLLPWQTRWIYLPGYINGGWWEYGSESIYATQVLLWLIIILFLIDRARQFVIPSASSGQALSKAKDPLNKQTIRDSSVATLLQNDNGRLMLAFWLGGVGQGILAIWQFFSQSTFSTKWLGLASHAAVNFNGDFVVETISGRWLRAYGAFGSPNILGGFLAVCLVIGLIMYLRFVKGEQQFAPTRDWRRGVLSHERDPASRRWQYALMAGQLIILSGLILSFSRGAWIAAGVGIIVAVVVGAHGRAPLRSLTKQVLFCLILIIFFCLTLGPLFTARLTGEGRLEERSLAERTSQLSEFRQVFFKHPWAGVGIGEYTAELYKLNPSRPPYYYQPVHNTYLLILAEVGIVGFAIVFMFLCFYVFMLRRNNPLYLSVIAVILVGAIFDHFWWSLYSGQILCWAVFGLGLSTNRNLTASVDVIK